MFPIVDYVSRVLSYYARSKAWYRGFGTRVPASYLPLGCGREDGGRLHVLWGRKKRAMIQNRSWDGIAFLLGYRKKTSLKIKPSLTWLHVSLMNWLSQMPFLTISSDLRVLVPHTLQTSDAVSCESSLRYLSLVCDTSLSSQPTCCD